MFNPSLVLATVNAPYSTKLDADELAYFLTHPIEAQTMAGPMSSFFGEVEPDLQMAFADLYHISHKQLAEAAKSFAAFSGESYLLAA